MATELSWEEIVRRVTVESNFPRIQHSAETWRAAFDQIQDIKDLVRRLSDRSATWKGAAAREFRRYLREVGEALDKTDDAHRRIKDGLVSCASDLKIAVESIPIPEWDLHRVQQAQQAYHSNADLPNLPANSFWNSLVERYGGTWAEQSVESWFGNRKAEAQRAYDKLEAAYNGILGGMPEGTDARVRRLNPNARTPGTDQPAKATRPRQLTSTMGQGLPMNQGLPTTAMTNPLGTSSIPQTVPGLTTDPGGFTSPDLGTGRLSELDSTYDPSTALAGAGTPADLAGLGGGGFGGAGAGGVGRLPIGPLASLPPDMMSGGSMAGGSMTSGPGGQQARLAPAGGPGAASLAGMGMMGAPLVGGSTGAQGEAGKDRRTGLQEDDDDVFGPGEVNDWLVT